MKLGVLATALCLMLAAGIPFAAFAGSGADGDGDTVIDALDNCSTLANASPLDCDDDTDGYGNACDADYNDDGVTGVPDFGTFTANFGAAGDLETDHNCDNVTGVPDFGTFTGAFGGPPGPSGLICAGTSPCP